MKIEKNKINDIPAIVWGEKSKKLIIAVHGNMSNKEDEVIKILADIATNKNYQILSFDLPEHGERKNNKKYLCNVQNCVNDLKQIVKFAKENYEEINLWACSMGAYFSLLAYKNENIEKSMFLSPIVNMKIVIDNMMKWSNVTEGILRKRKEIKTDFGVTLYWDYYNYVKENKIKDWDKKTSILYGNKDNMQDESVIKGFASKFNCKLDILENGEHYFHTKEQLKYYKNWLNKILDTKE